MEFEWDATKGLANIKKHGIPFSDAVETFFDPKGFQMVDRKHSQGERRFYWVGKSNKGRVLTTWFTRRASVIRIIGSAEVRNGENSGGCTMRQPKMSDLVIDRRGTKRMRAEAARTKKIKITINIDEDSLDALREMAGTTGAPYQKLLNQILKEGLRKRGQSESRLDRIERELERLKKKVAA